MNTALFRLALRLLPADLRDEYGDDIAALSADRLAAARSTPRRARMSARLAVFADVFATAYRSRRAGGPGPSKPRNPWNLDMTLGDLKYALRALMHRPGLTAVIVLTLGLGVGANAVIYSAIDSVVLRPFDFPEPDRVIAVGVEFPRLGLALNFFEAVSAPEFDDVRRQSTALTDTVGFDMGNRQITGGDVPENLRTGFWWGDPLPALGLQPIDGRSFLADETTAREPVALISERVWQRRFQSDPAAVGSTIQINDVDYTLIGVFPTAAVINGIDLWTPMWAEPTQMPRARRQFNVLGRLADGRTLQEVNTELETISRRTEQQHGAEFEEYAGWRLRALTFTDANVSNLKPAALVLIGMVAFVLLLVCANIASLLLASASSRQRELAVRTALGAVRGRILRQLMAESAVLAMLGCVCGLLVGWLGSAWLTANTPAALLPTTKALTINAHVVAYSATVSLIAALLFGLAPALQASRFDLHKTLTVEGRTATGGRGRRRLQNALVAVEVALAIALLAGAGFFVASFARLQRVDPGFDAENVLTMRLTLPWERYEGAAITNFFVDLADRVEAIPGVMSAASGSQFAPATFGRMRFTLPNQDATPESELPVGLLTITSADYFETLGIPIRAGRAFNTLDQPGSGFVGVISESLARRYFGKPDAVGERLKLGTIDDENLPWIEIVGIAGDTKNRGLGQPSQPEIYVNLGQVNGINNQLYLLVRTEGAPADVLPQVRDAVASLDPNQPVYNVATVDSMFDQGYAIESFAMAMISAFSFVALIIAAVGISGVVAHGVNERSREIGVRMALGAAGPEVRRLVVRQALWPVLGGGLVGLVMAVGIGQALSGMLFEVGGFDPATLSSVTVVLLLVALLAGYVPARRASGIDPVVALRGE